MSKIKGLRQKTGSNTYGDFVHFGADGIRVDMLSGLDNEQELKLGGNHISSIIENGNTTIITETYHNNNYHSEDENENETLTYTCVTTIVDGAELTEITVQLYAGAVNSANLLNTKSISIPAEGAITEELIETEEVSP